MVRSLLLVVLVVIGRMVVLSVEVEVTGLDVVEVIGRGYGGRCVGTYG